MRDGKKYVHPSQGIFLVWFFSILAFALCAAALKGGRILALHFGFADKPGGRKKHDNPVPPIGGLAILPVFFGLAWIAGYKDIVPWPLIAGVAALLIMGTIDEARTIRPYIKFAIMIWTACFVVIFGEAQIGNLGDLFGFGPVELQWMSKGFTVLCLALLMNAINMMDGIDGLAGGFCALVAFWFLIVCTATGQWAYVGVFGILLGTLLGFLAFNMRAPWRSSASVFLGDAGSLCLGLLLGWFSIRLTQMPSAPLEPITVIWIIAIPVMDAFALFIARSIRGLHPFNADRRHLHHRFIDAGLSPARTTTAILGLIALCAVIGFAAEAQKVPAVFLFALWMVLFTLHTIGIAHPRGYTMFTRFLRARKRS